jgi:hypothetical protein
MDARHGYAQELGAGAWSRRPSQGLQHSVESLFTTVAARANGASITAARALRTPATFGDVDAAAALRVAS